MHALNLLRKKNLPSVAITALNKKNLSELSLLKKELTDAGVERWQFQMAEPMGNLSVHSVRKDLVLTPEELPEIFDFAYDVYKEGNIIVNIADNLGYYDTRNAEINRFSSIYKESSGIWLSCFAGKTVLGILCNGDVVGCVSIRDRRFIEDNLRKTPLREIWTRPGAFSWNRNRKIENMKGFCRKCEYGSFCLGGCTALKLTTEGDLTNNRYCLYQVEFKKKIDMQSFYLKMLGSDLQCDNSFSGGISFFSTSKFSADSNC